MNQHQRDVGDTRLDVVLRIRIGDQLVRPFLVIVELHELCLMLTEAFPLVHDEVLTV